MRFLLLLLLVACSPQDVPATQPFEIDPGEEIYNAEEVGEDVILEAIKNVTEEKSGLNESLVNETRVPIKGVRFWLGTKHGSLTDLLREGVTANYTLKNHTYTVEVVFVGKSSEGLPEAKFRVNGKLTKALGMEEIDYFENKEFIYVREVYYKE